MEETALNKCFNGKDALFHYTKISTAIEHIIPSLTLKLSTLVRLSDPNEYLKRFFSYGSGVTHRPTKKDTNLEKYFKSCRIVSFCSNNDVKVGDKSTENLNYNFGWAKSRMWCQYADGHKGVCLVFDKEKIKRKFEEKGGFLEGIKYAKELEIPEIKSDCLEETEYLEYLKNQKDKIFFTKNIDYRDEVEFRGVIFDTKIEYIDIKDCLKGILLGFKVPKVCNPCIKKIAEDNNLTWSKLSWEFGFPRLDEYEYL